MSGDSKTAAVVLAAGFSRRLGRPKQTLVLAGETLVERAVRVALEAGLSPVIAVVPPEGDFGYSLQRQGAVVVLNDRAQEGMASSICLGVNVAHILKATGSIVMACDQVLLSPEHLRSLCADPDSVTGSGYGDRVGIPAYFPASAFPALLKLDGDVGARELLRGSHFIEAPELAFDIDTEEDLKQATAFLNEQP